MPRKEVQLKQYEGIIKVLLKIDNDAAYETCVSLYGTWARTPKAVKQWLIARVKESVDDLKAERDELVSKQFDIEQEIRTTDIRLREQRKVYADVTRGKLYLKD